MLNLRLFPSASPCLKEDRKQPFTAILTCYYPTTFSCYRVQTSYVTVEPKRRKQVPSPQLQPATPPHGPPPLGGGFQGEASALTTPPARGRQGGASGRELRRARIVITVKQTESYKKWLEENPLQAVIAGDGDDDEEADAGTSQENQQAL
jgi:hypothetical protein